MIIKDKNEPSINPSTKYKGKFIGSFKVKAFCNITL